MHVCPRINEVACGLGEKNVHHLLKETDVLHSLLERRHIGR